MTLSSVPYLCVHEALISFLLIVWLVKVKGPCHCRNRLLRLIKMESDDDFHGDLKGPAAVSSAVNPSQGQGDTMTSQREPGPSTRKRGYGQSWTPIRSCKTHDEFLQWMHAPYALSMGAKWSKKRTTPTLQGTKDYFRCVAGPTCQAQLCALYCPISDNVKISCNGKNHLHAEDANNNGQGHGLTRATKVEVEKLFSAGVTKTLQV